ncbi:MAG: CRISPR-associated endonuclease Cas1 [Bryobacteraceae bacterium]
MATLFVDHREICLELDSGALAVRRAGELERRIPLGLIDRIVITADVQLSARLLAQLGDSGIGVLLHARRSKAWAVISGAPAGDARRRLGQARMAIEPAWKNLWARRWVLAKARGQARLLRLEAEARPQARAALWRAAERIERTIERLRQEDLTAESARGLEGAASAAHFEGLEALLAPSLGFHGRNRRPPRDPVNATLSLIYTMLYAAAVEAARAAGLDADIGYLHEPARGRAGLACDLVEPLRPLADRVAIRLFRNRTLRADHFHTEDGACLLGKAGRRAFYEAVEGDLSRFRLQLRRLAGVVAKAADAAGVEAAPQSPQLEGEFDS